MGRGRYLRTYALAEAMEKQSQRIRILPLTLGSIFISIALLTITSYWFLLVTAEVLEPYLVSHDCISGPIDRPLSTLQDEVFHIRQALAYWHHQWRVWDPKITTPPGLYVYKLSAAH